MKKHNPKTFKYPYLLSIFFFWLSLKGLGTLLNYEYSTHYLLWNYIGYTFPFFVIAVVTPLIHLIMTEQFIKPRKWGYDLLILDIWLIGISMVSTFLIAYIHPSKLQEYYLFYRDARGLPVGEQKIDFIFTRPFIAAFAILTVVILYLCYRYVKKRKNFFIKAKLN